jgi:hypothetical protein
MDEQTIIEIWDLFKEYIPAKQMEIVATQFVNFLADHDDVDDDTISSLQGLDNNLDIAIKEFLDEGGADDYEEEEDFYEDED